MLSFEGELRTAARGTAPGTKATAGARAQRATAKDFIVLVCVLTGEWSTECANTSFLCPDSLELYVTLFGDRRPHVNMRQKKASRFLDFSFNHWTLPKFKSFAPGEISWSLLSVPYYYWLLIPSKPTGLNKNTQKAKLQFQQYLYCCTCCCQLAGPVVVHNEAQCTPRVSQTQGNQTAWTATAAMFYCQ